MIDKVKSTLCQMVRGELSLVRTFWLFEIVLASGLVLVFGYVSGKAFADIKGNLMELVSFNMDTLVVNLVWLALVAFAISVLVGLWRSATNYKGRGLWRVLAKIYVVLNVIGLIAALFMPAEMMQL